MSDNDTTVLSILVQQVTALGAKVDSLLEKVAGGPTPAQHLDHEIRLRGLERWRWMQAAIWALAVFLAPFAVVVLNHHL